MAVDHGRRGHSRGVAIFVWAWPLWIDGGGALSLKDAGLDEGRSRKEEP